MPVTSSPGVHPVRHASRRARRLLDARARAALDAVQPAAHRLRRAARVGLAVGSLAVVLSLAPGWLGYQPLEDASGGLALMSVAGAVPGDGAAGPVLVVPVPHLATAVNAIRSTAGRLILLAVPLLALSAASLLRGAGRQWPADRVPALRQLQPASHADTFPGGLSRRGLAHRGRLPRHGREAPPARHRHSSPRAGMVMLAAFAAGVAVAGLLGRRSPSGR